MKKIISLALAMCIMLTVCSTGLLSLTASAAQKIDGSDVMWSFDNMSKTLTFSGKGDIPNYDTYEDEKGDSTIPWGGCDYSSVVFGNEITGIGNYALRKSLSLTSVTIPETIKKIGKGAFSACLSLRQVTIKPGVTVISGSVFSGCTALENIELPDGLAEIGSYAFYKCQSLESIQLPGSVKKLGVAAFNSCTALKSFVAPESLEIIDNRAFYCAEALETVTLNDKLTSIGISAFDGCSKLVEITIPSGVNEIPESAFSGCSSLNKLVIPDSINTIGTEAFYLCGSLKSVNIPYSVKTIGDKAFGYGSRGKPVNGFSISGYDNSTAKTYALNNSIEFNSLGTFIPKSGKISDTLSWSIDENNVLTFEGTGAIGARTPDTIPEYLLSDPIYIDLCEGITSIGAYAFFGFTGTSGSIYIPESVTEIGEKAIGYCYNDTGAISTIPGFIISGYPETAAEQYANENEIIFSVILYNGEIGESATWSFDKDNAILTIGGTGAMDNFTLEELPYYSFYYFSDVIVADGITSIGDYAFTCVDDEEFSNAVTITVPKSVTSIGYHAIGYLYSMDPDWNIIEKVNTECVIKGYAGSAAEKYAADNGLTFIKLDSEPEIKLSADAKICVFDEENDSENKNLYVYGLSVTPESVLADLIISGDLTVIKPEKIVTGEKIVIKQGNDNYQTFTIIVVGDINSDGQVNSSDALAALQHAVETSFLTENALSAADVNNDGQCDSSDALAMLQISVEQKSLSDFYPKRAN